MTTQFNILVDLTYISNSFAGVSVFAYRLLDGLKEIHTDSVRFYLLVSNGNEQIVRQRMPEYEFITFESMILCGKTPPLRRFINESRLNTIIKKKKIDLLFSPYINLDSLTTGIIPHIGVLHDTQSFKLKGKQRIKKMIHDFFMFNLLNGLTEIITISYYSQKSLKEILPRLTTPISVIYNSISVCNPVYKKEVNDLKPYILNVNTLLPYKNLETLVRAFIRLKNKIPHKLIIKAKKLPYWTQVILPLVEKEALSDRVILISEDYSDAEIAALYASADLFVSPSLMEGFGFTPIEAAIHETPVICSTETALPETTLNLLNYYAPATDDLVLSEKIWKILSECHLESLHEISRKFMNVYSLHRQSSQFLEKLLEYKRE